MSFESEVNHHSLLFSIQVMMTLFDNVYELTKIKYYFIHSAFVNEGFVIHGSTAHGWGRDNSSTSLLTSLTPDAHAELGLRILLNLNCICLASSSVEQ